MPQIIFFRGKCKNPDSFLLVRKSAASRSIPQLLLPARQHNGRRQVQ